MIRPRDPALGQLMRSQTSNRELTLSLAAPTVAKSPTSAGPMTVPFGRTSSPASMSEPTALTSSPGPIAACSDHTQRVDMLDGVLRDDISLACLYRVCCRVCLWRHAQSPLQLCVRQGPPLALLELRSQGAGLWGCTQFVRGLPCNGRPHHVGVMQESGAVHLYYLDTSLCAGCPCQILCIFHLHYSIRSFWQLCACIEGHT